MSQPGERPDSPRHFEEISESAAMYEAELRAELRTPPARYYVYGLVDPRDGRTFYVGKGTGLRALAHGKRQADANAAKLALIDEIEADGLSLQYKILGWFSRERRALEVERDLITRRREELTNIASGGVAQSAEAQMDARKARAARMLAALVPFDEWKARHNPNKEAENLYWRVKHEMEKIAAQGYENTFFVPCTPREVSQIVAHLTQQVSP